jgi:hypothetical protein
VIIINITGNTTETVSAVLISSGTGASLYTAVTVQPNGGGARTVTGNFAGPLIDLDGADNFTINGLNTAGNSLILSNTNNGTVSNTSTIRFINDATGNSIMNTTILGATSSITLGTIFFSTGITTGNDNNTISNCNIADAAPDFPVNAVISIGAAGQENSNNAITGNNISNYFNAALATTAILVGAGNTDWTISSNRFFQTTSRTFTTGNPHRVIQVTGGSNYTVSGNTIGYASSTGTGIYTIAGAVTSRFLAIDIAAGTATPSVVNANHISDISFITSNNSSSASGIWCAINISAGDVNITSNSIGHTVGTGNISILPTVAGTLSVSITSSSTGLINITGNTIGSIDVLPSAALSGNMTGIQAQGTLGTVAITNNIIGNATENNMRIGTLGTTTGNGIIRAILNSNTGTVNITGNTARNLTHYSSNALSLFRAVEFQQGTGNISNNTISSIAANGTSVSVLTVEGAGILVTSAGQGINIENNTISNLNVINSSTASGITVLGIYLGSSVNGTTITRNKIYGFTNASTSVSTTVPGIMGGIYLRDATAPNPLTVTNNMISFGNGETTNTAMIGIWNHVNSATGYIARIYYNTVNIQGTASIGAQPSFCYLRGDFASTSFTGPVVDIRNNIFTNARNGGTGKHYAIANSCGAATSSATGWTVNASDYNILNADAATIGYWTGDQSFAGWQSAATSDAHSYSAVTVAYINNATDLHLVTTAGTNTSADGNATPISGVTNDYDNTTRNATTPDIGADEFTQGPLSIGMEYFKGTKQTSGNVLSWKAGCSSASVEFDIERSNDGRTFTSIGSFTATKARCALSFDFSDAAPRDGINYYRLKMKEADGQVSYSTVIAIINKSSGFKIVALRPTIITNGFAVIDLSSAQKDQVRLCIFNAMGKMIHQQTANVIAGSNTTSLNLSSLPAGNYLLSGYTADGVANTIRFILQ